MKSQYALLVDLFAKLSDRQEFEFGNAQLSLRITVGIFTVISGFINLIIAFGPRPPLQPYIFGNFGFTTFLLLMILTMEAVFHLKPSAAERIGDVDQNFIGLERLDDVPERADVQRSIGEDRAVETRDHDRRRVPVLRENVPHEIQPGFSRHVDVAEHQGKGLVTQFLPSLSRICGTIH